MPYQQSAIWHITRLISWTYLYIILRCCIAMSTTKHIYSFIPNCTTCLVFCFVTHTHTQYYTQTTYIYFVSFFAFLSINFVFYFFLFYFFGLWIKTNQQNKDKTSFLNLQHTLYQRTVLSMITTYELISFHVINFNLFVWI